MFASPKDDESDADPRVKNLKSFGLQSGRFSAPELVGQVAGAFADAMPTPLAGVTLDESVSVLADTLLAEPGNRSCEPFLERGLFDLGEQLHQT